MEKKDRKRQIRESNSCSDASSEQTVKSNRLWLLGLVDSAKASLRRSWYRRGDMRSIEAEIMFNLALLKSREFHLQRKTERLNCK